MVEVPEDEEDKPLTERDLRMFIFEHMANSDILPHILIQNMEAAFRWLVDGTVPASEPVRKPARVKLEANG